MPIILFIGLYGTSRSRGVENLILSVPYLDEGVLAFVSWGSLEDELKALAREQSLTDRVFFTEPVLPSEVVGYITSASVGVVTPLRVSFNHYYALPNKIFDYINAGLPVVTSNFPALRAVVEGYHLGKICDPEDPRDIAAAINWVLADKDRYEELKRNALEAAKVFNWENESKKLLDVYERLDSGKDGSAV